MRDPNRLDSFYDELKRIHKEEFPDWRFGQLFCNFCGWLMNNKKIDPFFPEENRILKLFKEYAGEE